MTRPPREPASDLDARAVFAFTVKITFDPVWHTLARMGVPEQDRADVAQEVFLAAWMSRASFDPAKGSLVAWISGIATNLALLHHRNQRRRPEMPFADLTDVAAGTDAMAAREARDFLYKLFQHVDPPKLAALIAREFENHTYEEIAELFGISVSTAHAWVKTARGEVMGAHARWEQEQRRRGLAVLPIPLAALFDADRSTPRAPRGAFEEVWRHVERRLDAELSTGAEPKQATDRERRRAIRPPGLRLPKLRTPVREILTHAAAAGAGVAVTLALLHPPSAAPTITAPIAVATATSAIGAARSEPPPATTTAALAIDPAQAPSVRAPWPSSHAVAAASASAGPVAGHDATLAAEVAEVDEVRAAFHRGDDAATLAALDRYDHDYPQGRFKGDVAAIRAQIGRRDGADGGP